MSRGEVRERERGDASSIDADKEKKKSHRKLKEERRLGGKNGGEL